MGRVNLKYDCGCEIQPFVVEGAVHGFDADVSFCIKHKSEAKRLDRNG
jgi:hypothetical protein